MVILHFLWEIIDFPLNFHFLKCIADQLLYVIFYQHFTLWILATFLFSIVLAIKQVLRLRNNTNQMHNTLKPNGNIPTEFNYIFSSQGPCCVTCEKSTTQQTKHKVKIEKYFIKKKLNRTVVSIWHRENYTEWWREQFISCGSVSFLTRELHACARASCRYDVGNGIRSLARSLDWSIPVNFFSILGFWLHLIVFGEQ